MPVDPSKIEEFDPETVPTVGQLLHELNNVAAARSEGDAAEHHSGKAVVLL